MKRSFMLTAIQRVILRCYYLRINLLPYHEQRVKNMLNLIMGN